MGASRLTTEDAEGAENFSFSGYYVFTVVSFVRLQTLPRDCSRPVRSSLPGSMAVGIIRSATHVAGGHTPQRLP